MNAKKKKSSEVDVMNDFFTPQVAKSIKDIPDLELAYYLNEFVGEHAFLVMNSHLDYANPSNAKKFVGNFSPAQVMLEARSRVESKRAITDNYVTTKMKTAKDVAVCDTTIFLTKEDGIIEKMRLERGAYDAVPLKVREAAVMANIIVLTQKPVVVTRNGEKTMVPVQTDTTGTIFPSYRTLPQKILQIYKTSKDVPGIVDALTTVLQDYKDKAQYVQLNSVVPYMSYISQGMPLVKDFTKVHTTSTPEREKEYEALEKKGVKMARDSEGKALVKGFARPPTHKTTDTLISAYRFLQESRAIRGEKGGGITSLTAMYYHGDFVLSMWRTYSLVFNILAVRVNCLESSKGFPPLPGAVLLESVDAKGLSQHATDMIRMSVPTMAAFKSDFSARKEYGLQKLGTGPFMVFHVLNRSFSLNKNGALIFTPSFQELRNQIRSTVLAYAQQHPGAQLHHFFHVIVCQDLLSKAYLVSSAHPHPGFGWVYAKAEKGGAVNGIMARDCTKAQYVEKERIFAHRVILSNAYKNYYQFHRVPYVLIDQAFPISPMVFLMRRTKASVTRILLQIGEEDVSQKGDEERNIQLEAMFQEYVVKEHDEGGQDFLEKKKRRDPTPQENLNDFYDNNYEEDFSNVDEGREADFQEGEVPNFSAIDDDHDLFG